ncbi:transposase [Beggiatoa sp. PS]|nr:transposase [Beggiatoa sp. PS]
MFTVRQEDVLPKSDGEGEGLIRHDHYFPHETQGAEVLLLKYKGSLPYENKSNRKQVVCFLQRKTNETVEELRDYLEQEYHVVYKSKQSSFLIKRRWVRFLKTQFEDKRKEEIQHLLNEKKTEIESGSLTVFLLDEWH